MKRIPELLDESKYFCLQPRNYEIHRRKIANIMHKTSTVMDVKREIILHKYYEQKDKSARFSIKEKQLAIERENDLIVKKIVKVSNRPNQTMERAHSESSGSLKYHTNLINMKREFDHIALENQRLAEKLMKSKSSLYQKKMNDAYAQHLRRKEMISKYEFDEQEGHIRPKYLIVNIRKLKSLEKLARRGIESQTQSVPARGTNNFSRITEQDNEQF